MDLGNCVHGKPQHRRGGATAACPQTLRKKMLLVKITYACKNTQLWLKSCSRAADTFSGQTSEWEVRRLHVHFPSLKAMAFRKPQQKKSIKRWWSLKATTAACPQPRAKDNGCLKVTTTKTHADKVAVSIELLLLQLLVKVTAEKRHNCATCHAHVQLLPGQAFKKGGETAACPQPTAKGHWLLKSAQKKNMVSFAFACHIFATILHTSGETAACHKP